MKKRMIAGILALSLGLCLAACGESAQEKAAVEAMAESAESELNPEERPEAEEAVAEANSETEEAVAEVNPEEEVAAETSPEEEAGETEEIDETEELEKTEEELLAQAWNPEDYDSDNLSIVFGSYEQDNNLDNGAEPLEWNVIKEEDGKVLLICKYGIEAMQYHTSEDDVTWETCSLRQWLNHDFIDTAFDDEKVDIQLSLLENKDGLLSKGGNATQDYVFLLSEEEFDENMEFDARTQLSEYAYQKADKVYIEGKTLARTWLRTPGSAQNATAVIDIEGHLDDRGDYNWMGINAVRPVMWVTKTPEIEAQIAAFEGFPIGSYVTLGRYEQNTKLDGPEPIEWQILDRKDGKALLISRYILDSYACSQRDDFLQVRDWLNNDFYNTAFDEEKEYIVETNQEYGGYGMYSYRRFVDSVFLLSSTEVETYFDGNKASTRATVGAACAEDIKSWWIRDKIKDQWGSAGSSDIAYVNHSGEVVWKGRGTKGIRPAIWVDMAVLKSELAIPEEQGYGDIDSVLHLVEGLEGNVTFGSYEQDGNLENGQEPIEWLILSRDGDRMLLISKCVLDAKYYYETDTSETDIGWEDSTVRTWLNSDFYNAAFTDEEKSFIPLSKITSSWGRHDPIIEETEDYVFLLSPSEVKEYFEVDGGRYHDVLIAERTEYAAQQGLSSNRWMARSYKVVSYKIDAYNGYGTLETVSDTPGNGGVRPAIWVTVN